MFDHAALAEILKSRFGETDVTPHSLRLEHLAVAPDVTSFYFELGGWAYRVRFDPLNCERLTKPIPTEQFSIAPDGQSAICLPDGNLLLRNLKTGAERILGGDGMPDNGYGIGGPSHDSAHPVGLQWAPDSSRLIVPRTDQRHVSEYPFLELAPQDGSFRPKMHMRRIALVGERPPEVSWHVFDIPLGEHRLIDFPPALRFVLQDQMPSMKSWWSGDNRHRYMLAYGVNMDSAYLFDVDLASGSVRTVVEEHLTPRTNLNGVL